MMQVEVDQRRAWLDELLAKRHLWPSQVTVVRMLAAELGVEIEIWSDHAPSYRRWRGAGVRMR